MTINRAVIALSFSFIVGISAFIAPGFLTKFLNFPSFDSGFSSDLSRWSNVIHYSHNAYFQWRFDPLLTAILNDVSGAGILKFYLAFFASGSFVWFFSTLGQRLLPALCQTLVLLFSLFGLFGWDTTVISFLSWLPWMLVSCSYLLQSQQKALGAVFFVFVCIREAQSANYLCFLASAIVFCIFYREIRAVNTRFRLFICLSLALPAILPLINVRAPLFPDYPPLANLVPSSGIAGIARPAVGPDVLLPTINREFIRDTYRWTALLLTFISASFIGIRVAKKDPFLTVISFLLFATSLSLFLDSGFIPETISQIAPLESISRLIPGIIFIPLTPIATALSLFFAISMFSSISPTRSILLQFIFVLVLSSVPGSNGEWGAKFFNLQDSARSPETLRHATDFQAITSPSYYLVKQLGDWVLSDRNIISSLKFSHHISRLNPEISVSSHSEFVSNILDRKSGSRWSSMTGKQEGSEWIHIKFAKTFNVRGIKLSTGDFKTDFPRGIDILYAESCNGYEINPEIYHLAIRYKNWLGPVKYTSNGYPYFGSQADVKIAFPKALKAACLLIRQIGSTSHFDWSVADIALAFSDIQEK